MSPASTFWPSLKFTLRTVSVIFAVSVIDSLACAVPERLDLVRPILGRERDHGGGTAGDSSLALALVATAGGERAARGSK
jgi:hypothetical protein